MEDIFFKMQQFKVIENEDQETNPHRYGKELAVFLCVKLKKRGYPKADYFPEDWGWYINCPLDSFSLEIGCGNVETVEGSENPELYKTDHVIWTCFVEPKVPFFRNLFKRIDTTPEKEKLHKLVHKIITEIPDVKFIKQSEIV